MMRLRRFQFELVLIILSIIICCFMIRVQGQKIKLQYRQEDSETHCTSGLISEMDTVVFKSLVDYSENLNITYALFEIKRKEDQSFKVFQVINVQSGCLTTESIQCRQIGTHVFEIVLEIPAYIDYSVAMIRGSLETSSKSKLHSEVQIFPEIYDAKNTFGRIWINGIEKISDNNSCDTVLKTSSNIHILFVCKSQASPCLIELSASDLHKPIRGKDHLVYTYAEDDIDVLFVTIKFAPCSLAGKKDIIQCRINIGPDYSLLPVIPVLSLFLLVVFCIVIAMHRIFKQRKILIKQIQKRVLHLGKQKKSTILDDVIDLETNSEVSDHPVRQRKMTQDFQILAETHETSSYLESYICVKKSSHRDFVPINELTMENMDINLDRNFCNPDLLLLIKAIGNLTVKVTVTYMSPGRPNSVKVYSGSSFCGTGMVTNVQRYKEVDSLNCQCLKCESKSISNRSKEWGKIKIKTASDIVFDDIEARQSLFQLFYDGETYAFTTLEGMKVNKPGKIRTDQGWIEVECASCDEYLLNKLESYIARCTELMAKVNITYSSCRKVDKLAVIVAHPHGAPKHVSFGYWRKRKVVSSDQVHEYTKYTYTTSTCPGSSGAFVYILGVSDLLQQQYHFHSGSKYQRKNFSCIGKENLYADKETFLKNFNITIREDTGS
ncbi:unnamed protein product [Lymnaea stagnalis]|uniref:Uncharacterized protein n=1 Tax=Lymnaea stagnalis TaxID=6523 RepID=A0AAV2HB93_LYMST